MSTEPIISIVELTQPIVVVIESSQHVQPIVEHVQMENPRFSRFQPNPISNHSTKTLRQISMFLEQVAQNATT
jgi:hypothetical protein